MRISDWSSDVCSSDLLDGDRLSVTDDFELTDVVERAAPYVTRACEPYFIVAGDRRRAATDGDGVAVGPDGELAGLHDRAGVRLAADLYRRAEVDLFAPCTCPGRESKCRQARFGRGCAETLRAADDRADGDHEP